MDKDAVAYLINGLFYLTEQIIEAQTTLGRPVTMDEAEKLIQNTVERVEKVKLGWDELGDE